MGTESFGRFRGDNNVCEAWAGSCSNGHLKHLSLRTKDNDCASCNSGYWLNNGRCDKWTKVMAKSLSKSPNQIMNGTGCADRASPPIAAPTNGSK